MERTESDQTVLGFNETARKYLIKSRTLPKTTLVDTGSWEESTQAHIPLLFTYHQPPPPRPPSPRTYLGHLEEALLKERPDPIGVRAPTKVQQAVRRQ